MTGRVKHKSRGSDHSSSKYKKKKSRKRSASSSSDCVVVSSSKDYPIKDNRRKSQKRKRRRSSSSSSVSSNSFISSIKLDSQPRQLLGERPEFCRNRASFRANNGESFQRIQLDSQRNKRSKKRPNNVYPKERFPMLERRVECAPMNDRGRGRKRGIKERLGDPPVVKKSKKSRKRRRSSSRSSYSSGSSSSRSFSGSSRSSSRSSSSTSSYERRRRKKKKKLAKKIKRAERKRREEKRKLKKMREISKEPVKEKRRSMPKATKDRLLKDINVELADRARAMAPMTREEWEKKQSVIRRVYDGETGRHRLIKGDGEVLEEIVSRDRHMEINRQATKGDGELFQARLRINK